MIVPVDLYNKRNEERAREDMPDYANMPAKEIFHQADISYNVMDFMGAEYFDDDHLESGVLLLFAIRDRYKSASSGDDREVLKAAFEKAKAATDEMISRRRSRRQRQAAKAAQ